MKSQRLTYAGMLLTAIVSACGGALTEPASGEQTSTMSERLSVPQSTCHTTSDCHNPCLVCAPSNYYGQIFYTCAPKPGGCHAANTSQACVIEEFYCTQSPHALGTGSCPYTSCTAVGGGWYSCQSNVCVPCGKPGAITCSQCPILESTCK